MIALMNLTGIFRIISINIGEFLKLHQTTIILATFVNW
jgi:hypothetical protein